MTEHYSLPSYKCFHYSLLQDLYWMSLQYMLFYCLLLLPNKDVKLVIKTADAHLSSIFKKKKDGSWIKRKRPNKLVDEVRELSEQFDEFVCELDSDSDLMVRVKEMAKRPSRI